MSMSISLLKWDKLLEPTCFEGGPTNIYIEKLKLENLDLYSLKINQISWKTSCQSVNNTERYMSLGVESTVGKNPPKHNTEII